MRRLPGRAWRPRSGGGGAVPGWLALGPHYSYRFGTYTTVSSGDVESISDELAPGDPSRKLSQADISERGVYLPVSSAPSGRPAMQGSPTAGAVSGSRLVGLGAGPVTAYAAIVKTATGTATETAFGEGGAATAEMFRMRFANDRGSFQYTSGQLIAAGSLAAGAAWVEAVRDVPGGEWSFTLSDGTTIAGVAPAAVATDVFSIGSRVSMGSDLQFFEGETLWDYGYPRVLSAAERLVARQAAADWLGI